MQKLMNKLIPSALFSARDAKEQIIRDAKHSGRFPFHDVRKVDDDWDRVAEGFRKYDPAGRKMADLIHTPKK